MHTIQNKSHNTGIYPDVQCENVGIKILQKRKKKKRRLI